MLEAVRGRGACLVDRSRLWMLYEMCNWVALLPGEAVEFGVYKGGSAYFLRQMLGDKRPLHLYDSFQGLPEPSKHDGWHKGDLGDVSVEEVDALVRMPNTHVHRGFWNRDTEVPSGICLAHIDADIYRSTKDALSAVWPNMVPGGVVIVDDYNFEGCEGAHKAVNEFLSFAETQPSHLPLWAVPRWITPETGQCLIFR